MSRMWLNWHDQPGSADSGNDDLVVFKQAGQATFLVVTGKSECSMHLVYLDRGKIDVPK